MSHKLKAKHQKPDNRYALPSKLTPEPLLHEKLTGNDLLSDVLVVVVPVLRRYHILSAQVRLLGDDLRHRSAQEPVSRRRSPPFFHTCAANTIHPHRRHPTPALGTDAGKRPSVGIGRPGGHERRSPGVFRRPGFQKRRLPTLPTGGSVPSAMVSLTSLFGMGRGGSSPL